MSDKVRSIAEDLVTRSLDPVVQKENIHFAVGRKVANALYKKVGSTDIHPHHVASLLSGGPPDNPDHYATNNLIRKHLGIDLISYPHGTDEKLKTLGVTDHEIHQLS